MDRAVFLDRDGVINQKQPEGKYVTAWSEFEFLPNAAEAIKALNDLGYLVIVVTNQRGVALGAMSEAALEEIHRRMIKRLAARGARIDAVYYCPHDKGECDCRKPATGLFMKARRDFPGIDFTRSYVIGDSGPDIEAGRRLGCKTILIGPDSKKKENAYELNVDYIIHNLWDAVKKYFII